MNILAAVHVAIAKRARLAAASAALLLIAIAIAVTSSSGGDGGTNPSVTDNSAAAPAAPAGDAGDPKADEHSHDSNIYVLNVRSRRVKRLTDGQIAQQPSWAPNKQITFSAADCDDACFSQLFYVDRKGINQVLVQVKMNHHLFSPTWAPGGRRIAAVALGRGIFSVAPGERRLRKLTGGQSDEAPDWSPRGNWIAFDKRVRGTNYDLFAVNAVTRKVRRLTHDPLQQTNPAWSPDGSRLAFAEQQPSGRWVIVTMRPDGSGRKHVTSGHISAQEPAWSPDGTRIAFVKQGLDTAAIAVIGSDGRGLRRVTTGSFFASTPAWSPDGQSIAFAAAPVEKPKS
jgi:Tol biopolymer transport system component